MTSKQNKSKKYWKARADRLFSLWVRQRDFVDEICRCITCGTPHFWRLMHCGHFMSRRYEGTRYHEKNANSQCVHCNTFDQGRQYEHGLAIDGKHGRGTARKLNIMAKISCKRSWFDYKLIGDEILEKLKVNNFEIR